MPYSEDFHGYYAKNMFWTTHFSIRRHFWPPGSPDLSAPDALKHYIFQISPAALQELRTRIPKETVAISREELEMPICITCLLG